MHPPARPERFSQNFNVRILFSHRERLKCALCSFRDRGTGHDDPFHDVALAPSGGRSTHRFRRLRVRPSPEVRRLWMGFDSGSGRERPRLRPRRDEEPRGVESELRRPRLRASETRSGADLIRRISSGAESSASGVLMGGGGWTPFRRSARRCSRAARRAASASSALRDRWLGTGRCGSGAGGSGSLTVSASMTLSSEAVAAIDWGGFRVACMKA